MDRLILFLDFDGTLPPIVPCPNRARLSRSVRETLWKLIGLLPVVAISGRIPEDLRRRVGLRKVCWVGHHGLSCLEAEGGCEAVGHAAAPCVHSHHGSREGPSVF